MPYLKQKDRERILVDGKILLGEVRTGGELNYALTMIALAYIKAVGKSYQHSQEVVEAFIELQDKAYRIPVFLPITKTVTLGNIKDLPSLELSAVDLLRNFLYQPKDTSMLRQCARGAIECCKLELYRRMIGPYEDQKIEENGDVYENI